jgi:hypothetical protein
MLMYGTPCEHPADRSAHQGGRSFFPREVERCSCTHEASARELRTGVCDCCELDIRPEPYEVDA